MASGPIQVVNPVKIGSFEKNTGVTIYEDRIKQTGKVVEVHFNAAFSASVPNPYQLGNVKDVDLPPKTIRSICGAGTAAYDATHTAYILFGYTGSISIYRSNATDTNVNIDIVYTVD